MTLDCQIYREPLRLHGVRQAALLAGLSIADICTAASVYAAEYSFTTLPTPPGGGFFQPNGINNSGQIVGLGVSGSNFTGLVYSGGAYTPFNNPDPTAINDLGQIVGLYVDSNGVVGAFEASPTPSNPPYGRT